MNDFKDIRIQNWLDGDHLLIIGKAVIAKCQGVAIALSVAAAVSQFAVAPVEAAVIVPTTQVIDTAAQLDAQTESFNALLNDVEALTSKIERRQFRASSTLAKQAAEALASTRQQPAEDWARALLGAAATAS